MAGNKKSKQPKPTIGWREWVSLPLLNVPYTKVKVDTGARSSAIHAWDIEEVTEGGVSLVRFSLHPYQRETKTTITATAELVEYRTIKSSGGHITSRPVILTEVQWQDQRWPIELTLVARDAMGFRMLLGREAVRRRFLVDAGHSFLGGHPPENAIPQEKMRKKKKKAKPQD